MLCNGVIMKGKATEDDFIFIKSSVKDDGTPDYNGFRTQQARETGRGTKYKTIITFKPLINKTPSDPSTVLTAMHEVEKVSNEAGQTFSIFTCDQQLYRVCVDIVWANPSRWANFFPVLAVCTC